MNVNPIRLTTTLLVAVLVAGGLSLAAASPSHADAANRTCEEHLGYKLGSYSTYRSAYSWTGDLMWRIYFRKRWCYNDRRNRVGTVFFHHEVRVYNANGAAWKNGGSTRDEWYTSYGPTGIEHPNYPRWGHVHRRTVKMLHCLVAKPVCFAEFWTFGIKGYQDGSKRLIEPYRAGRVALTPEESRRLRSSMRQIN